METAHLVEFAEETCNIKHFLYSVNLYSGMQKHESPKKSKLMKKWQNKQLQIKNQFGN